MPRPKNHRQQLRNLRSTGCDTKTANLTATALWDQSPEEAHKDQKHMMARYALEGAALDIVGELMLKYRQQEHHVDIMCRDLKKDNLPASFLEIK